MKRCKTCNAMVHIESNTCPSCGGHSFHVMDVKVCPLCGKVNDISSGFCEYCGKAFGESEYSEAAESYSAYDPAPDYGEGGAQETPFPAKRPISDSERAMLRYLTLRPEVTSDGKEKKYAYYVSDENVPIVILPTFETDKEKNIKIEIMLLPESSKAPESAQPSGETSSEDESANLQLPKETKRNELFTERKVSRKMQFGISLLLSLFAIGALVGFFLPIAGPQREYGLSLMLGMIGYNDSGAAVVELLKAGGILGKITYVSFCVLLLMLVVGIVLNLCFMRHSRGKKTFLLIVWAIALLALVLVVIGNIFTLDAKIQSMGLGIYLIACFLVAQFLVNLLAYDR